MSKLNEVFISVDVETSGPVPGKYSLLSIGACRTDGLGPTFSCEIKPTSEYYVPEALEVTGLSLEALELKGLTPYEAMDSFKSWIASVTGPSESPVFVGLNASFDWSFINYYFHIYLGENPFGFTALDIKSLYMGSYATSWADTRSSRIAKKLKVEATGNHDALKDAEYQAILFRAIMDSKK
ncbi:3'-5' exonuclease [Pantoea sp. JK]|uniref:3'-5' exonuclease n=1 Tax=Pantoea sp. JK TaxID=2871703 RepID=UPI002238D58E|nr:3'-5' exonuclease [Pantoea sp. JK]MCW6034467.1 3'-5' exonuclease [Pantoea sp. JK]